jgi:molybdopterin/thiamine biosynthesis adenylyltransferase
LEPDVHLGLLGDFAATDYDVLIDVHNHPFSVGGTVFSSIDDRDNLAQARYLISTLASYIERNHPQRRRSLHSVSLVLDQTSLSARVTDSSAQPPFTPIDQLIVLGEQLEIQRPNNAPEQMGHDKQSVFDRQRDFISEDRQRDLHRLHVGLVGCGGLGAIVAEQLRRLGFSRLTLVDDDLLEESNLNRWQTGTMADVGQPKTSVLAARLQAMLPGDTDISKVQKAVFDNEALRGLKTCDVILGAVDNHAARYTLNRFCTQYLIPYLDAGVVVRTEPEVDFQHRLFTVIPGETSCMECSRFELLDRENIAQCFADPMHYRLMRRQGYVKEAPDVSAPSVYPLNMQAASVMVSELLNLVCGYRPLARLVYGEFREGAQQTSRAPAFVEPPDECCPNCSFYLGRGDTEPVIVPTDYQAGRVPAESKLESVRQDKNQTNVKRSWVTLFMGKKQQRPTDHQQVNESA